MRRGLNASRAQRAVALLAVRASSSGTSSLLPRHRCHAAAARSPKVAAGRRRPPLPVGAGVLLTAFAWRCDAAGERRRADGGDAAGSRWRVQEVGDRGTA